MGRCKDAQQIQRLLQHADRASETEWPGGIRPVLGWRFGPTRATELFFEMASGASPESRQAHREKRHAGHVYLHRAVLANQLLVDEPAIR
jgi:hypothetical protein